MIITAVQIREARRLLRRSSATLAMKAGVGFHVVLRAQLDAEIHSVGSDALRVIKQSLMRSGVQFTTEGGVYLTRAPPSPLALAKPGRSLDA